MGLTLFQGFLIAVGIIFLIAVVIATLSYVKSQSDAVIEIKAESKQKTYHIPLDGFFRPGEHIQLAIVGASKKDLAQPIHWYYSLDDGKTLSVISKGGTSRPECQLLVPDCFTTNLMFVAKNDKRGQFAHSHPISVTPSLEVLGPKTTLLVNQVANFVLTCAPSVMSVLQPQLQTSTDDGKTWVDVTSSEVRYSSITHTVSWMPTEATSTATKIRIRSTNLVELHFPTELSVELPGSFTVVEEHPSKTPTGVAGTLLTKILVQDLQGDVGDTRFAYGENIRVTWETTAPEGTKLKLQWSTSADTGFVDLLTTNANNQSATSTLPTSSQVTGSDTSEVSIYLRLISTTDENEWIVSNPVILLPTNEAWSFDNKTVLTPMYASSFHVPFFFPGATREIANTSNWHYKITRGTDELTEGLVLSLVFLDTPGKFQMHFSTDEPKTLNWLIPAGKVEVDDVQVSMSYGDETQYKTLTESLVLRLPGDLPLDPWGSAVEVGYLGSQNQISSFLDFSEAGTTTFAGGIPTSFAYRNANLKDHPVVWQMVFPDQKDELGNPYVLAFDVSTRSEDGDGILSAIRVPSTMIGKAKIRISPAGFPERFAESREFLVTQLFGLGQAPGAAAPSVPVVQKMAGSNQKISIFGVYDQTLPFITHYDMTLSLEYAAKPIGSTEYPVGDDFVAADFGVDFTSDATGYSLILSEVPNPVLTNQVFFRVKATYDTSSTIFSTFTYTAYTTPDSIPIPSDFPVSYTVYSTGGSSSAPVSSLIPGDQVELCIKSGATPSTSQTVQVLAVTVDDAKAVTVLDGFEVTQSITDSKSILLDTSGMLEATLDFSSSYRFLLIFDNQSCYTSTFTLDPTYKVTMNSTSGPHVYRFQMSFMFLDGRSRNFVPRDFTLTFNFNATDTGDRTPITIDLSERPDFADNPLVEDLVVDDKTVNVIFKPSQNGGKYFPPYNPFTAQSVATDLFQSIVVKRKGADSSTDVTFTEGLGILKTSLNEALAPAHGQKLPAGSWMRSNGQAFLDERYDVLVGGIVRGKGPEDIFPDLVVDKDMADFMYVHSLGLDPALVGTTEPTVPLLQTFCEVGLRLRWVTEGFDLYTASGAKLYITTFFDRRFHIENIPIYKESYYKYSNTTFAALPVDWCIRNKFPRSEIYNPDVSSIDIPCPVDGTYC